MNRKLNKFELDKIFEERILPSISSVNTKYDKSVYILGGQPGSGKSAYAREILLSDPDFVFVNGDDYRGYHPDYYYFLKSNEKNAADLTQEAVNYWIERAIDFCISTDRSVIVEGTMRRKEVPLNTAKIFSKAGYNVSLVFLAVPYELSLASMNFRYADSKKFTGFARYTKKESHDEAFEGIKISVKELVANGDDYNFVVVKRVGEEVSEVHCNRDLVLEKFLELQSRKIEDLEIDFINRNIDLEKLKII